VFNFRRKSRAEIHAENVDARFRPEESGALNNMFGLLASQARYERTEIARGVNLYSARAGANTLVVAFGGAKGRLNMPLFMILEAMDDSRYDVLLLADLNKLHFERGIANYASSMPELVDKIGKFAERQGYGAIITYGTSMGGFPALRAGDLIGAGRSISIGGRFLFHPARLRKKQHSNVAFDLLCACRQPFRSQFYLLYAEGQHVDREHAAILRALAPQSHLIAFPGDDHNFPYQMRGKGKLDVFLNEMLDVAKQPDDQKLIALMQ